MMARIQPRVRLLSRQAPALAVALTLACSSGSGSAPWEIISPSTQNVVVLPGQSVRFEIRTGSGGTVEYRIDETRTEPGPVFVLQPTAQHHVVEALIRAGAPTATPDVVLFTVEVEAPGNLPPQIGSFTVEPGAGEAETTEFSARVVATDADGTVATLSVDWGDGTPLSTGTSSPFVATHTYAAEGTYTVTARAVDDVGVPATTTRQISVAPHNDHPVGLLHSELLTGGPPQGTSPLMVRLRTQGNDPDGTIATWEIDKDLGAGFELIAPGDIVNVTYPFREDPYMPVLRLTDNLGAVSEIPVDQDIITQRDVSAQRSSITVAGNARFAGTPIAPAVWADGSDPLGFTIFVRDSEGHPVPGVRVRVQTGRGDLIAPDGSNLGPAARVLPGPVITADANGLISGSIVTDVSTRVEAMPDIGFEPFRLFFEVDLARDVWVDFDIGGGIELNANTTVAAGGGQVNMFPAMACPGQEVEILVTAREQGGGPGGAGPAAGKYTTLLFSNETPLPNLSPAPGFGNWRTNGSGQIRFRYTPVRADQSRLFLAWVDGQPLDDLGTIFLQSPAQCGGN